MRGNIYQSDVVLPASDIVGIISAIMKSERTVWDGRKHADTDPRERPVSSKVHDGRLDDSMWATIGPGGRNIHYKSITS